MSEKQEIIKEIIRIMVFMSLSPASANLLNVWFQKDDLHITAYLACWLALGLCWLRKREE